VVDTRHQLKLVVEMFIQKWWNDCFDNLYKGKVFDIYLPLEHLCKIYGIASAEQLVSTFEVHLILVETFGDAGINSASLHPQAFPPTFVLVR
jgi:hypothetical protein